MMKSQSSGEALGFVVMLGFMCSVDTVLSELDSNSMCVAGFHWFGVCVCKLMYSAGLQ